MIKINLLPPNLYEGKVIRNIGIAFGVFALVIAGGMIYWNGTITAKTATIAEQATYAEQLSKQADGIKSEATSMRSGIAPITDKVKFFDAVKVHNESFGELYSEVARFTYTKVRYSQVTLNPDGSLALQASAPSIGDIGRYLLNMYTAKHLFQSVVVSTAPTLADITLNAGAGTTPAASSTPTAPASSSGAAPTAATAGIEAIARSQANQVALKRGKMTFTFAMQCQLTPDWKTKITAPVAPGAPAAGAPM